MQQSEGRTFRKQYAGRSMIVTMGNANSVEVGTICNMTILFPIGIVAPRQSIISNFCAKRVTVENEYAIMPNNMNHPLDVKGVLIHRAWWLLEVILPG